MTCLIQFNGRELDIDPTEFTGVELSLLKQRTALTFNGLIKALQELDGDAIRGLFWVAERRLDPELKFSDYAGPSLRVFMSHLTALTDAVEEMGKDLTTPETPGSPSSSSEADAAEPNSML